MSNTASLPTNLANTRKRLHKTLANGSVVTAQVWLWKSKTSTRRLIEVILEDGEMWIESRLHVEEFPAAAGGALEAAWHLDTVHGDTCTEWGYGKGATPNTAKRWEVATGNNLQRWQLEGLALGMKV